MRIAIVASERYAINANDFYLFYRDTEHEIVGIFQHRSVAELPWFLEGKTKKKSRESILVAYPEHLIKWWDTHSGLLDMLNEESPDYVCIGNGSDETGQILKMTLPSERLLFSEYGWFPWSECFYISRYGCGPQAEPGKWKTNDLENFNSSESQLEHTQNIFKAALDRSGEEVPNTDFIYVPLQVDFRDFKFNFTRFKKNIDFLKFIDEIVPADIEILVKNHPLNRKPTDFSELGRFKDISELNYSKHSIYESMRAMMVINSTAAIEALAYKKAVFTYGTDIFSNKSIVYEGVLERSTFEKHLNTGTPNPTLNLVFLNELLKRQINRKKCVEEREQYTNRHFWNTSLS